MLKNQIEELKNALEQAQVERRRKIEYDQIADKINALSSREDLESYVPTRLPAIEALLTYIVSHLKDL